jgi:hypothetical protein
MGMRKSARILGQGYGLTAQEMNFVLKEDGFLSGEPGNYTVTEKGARYADEQDHSRGTGGYAQYNRAWTTRTWRDGIEDELDITEDRKKEIRQVISAAKQRIGESGNEGIASERDVFGGKDADTAGGEGASLAAAVGVVLLVVSAYGVYRAAPYISRLWNDKAAPGLKNIKDRVLAKQKVEEEEAGGEGGSSNSKED